MPTQRKATKAARRSIPNNPTTAWLNEMRGWFKANLGREFRLVPVTPRMISALSETEDVDVGQFSNRTPLGVPMTIMVEGMDAPQICIVARRAVTLGFNLLIISMMPPPHLLPPAHLEEAFCRGTWEAFWQGQRVGMSGMEVMMAVAGPEIMQRVGATPSAVSNGGRPTLH